MFALINQWCHLTKSGRLKKSENSENKYKGYAGEDDKKKWMCLRNLSIRRVDLSHKIKHINSFLKNEKNCLGKVKYETEGPLNSRIG